MSATPLQESKPRVRPARAGFAPLGISLADWLRIATHIGALIPLALLLWDGYHNHLTANPIQEITFRTGKTAIILLMLSLLSESIGSDESYSTDPISLENDIGPFLVSYQYASYFVRQ